MVGIFIELKFAKKTSARLDPWEIWDVRLMRRFLNIYKKKRKNRNEKLKEKERRKREKTTDTKFLRGYGI